jgi:hypothetical protein
MVEGLSIDDQRAVIQARMSNNDPYYDSGDDDDY